MYSIQCSVLCKESVQLYVSVLYHSVSADELEVRDLIIDRPFIKKYLKHNI